MRKSLGSNTRSPPFRPPRLTMRPGLIKANHNAWRIPRANGSLRTGLSVRLRKLASPTSDGSRPHLCAALFAVHTCRDCRRRRRGCAGFGSYPKNRCRSVERVRRASLKRARSCRRGIGQSPPPGPIGRPVSPVLAADLSAQLRDRLLGELSGLQSGGEAAGWAQRSLPAKNTLIVADAQLVEDYFRVKMAALGEAQPGELPEAAQDPNPAIAPPQPESSSDRA